MRLKYIQLTNFRQFYQRTPKVEFAHGTKNVTVIHGMNGAGKTAFLNAFTWVLYGSFSKGFRNTEQLINKRAVVEAKIGQKVECLVELAFDHGGKSYLVKRSVDAIVAVAGEYPMLRPKDHTLYFLDSDGQWKPARDVESTIGKILPRDLHSYFFFDGERVERIVDPGHQDRADLARAVKTLLGLEILERSVKHLKRAKRHFEDEIAKYGSNETKDLVLKKEQLISQSEKLEETIGRFEKNIELQKEIVSNLNQRMRKLDTVKHLQSRRDALKETMRLKRESYLANLQNLKAKLSDSAYMLHTVELGSSFVALIGELRKKGELPAGIKKQFVEKLLASQLCICGRSLDSAADKSCCDARNTIENWLKESGLQEIEDCALALGAKVGMWSELRRDVQSRFEELNAKGLADLEDLAQADLELKKIAKELEGSPEEEVSSLQKKITNEEKIRDDYVAELGSARHEYKRLDGEIETLESELDKVEAKNAKQQVAKRRRDTVEEVSRAMVEILKLMDLKWRTSLESRIQTIFREISVKPYVPKLNQDYSIVLEDGITRGDVAFSQGESLVLSFSFIASIIEEAKKLNAQKNDLKGPDSSQYPLVMDSPFGALDDTNRSHVSSKISLLADQVIPMVSKTQWRDEVQQAMAPKIGRSWVLTYHNPRKDTLISEILIGSKTYPLITRSPNEYEYTTIEEATDA
ncbi:MAG: AAA family ATPase [Nibricoccus sp.]